MWFSILFCLWIICGRCSRVVVVIVGIDGYLLNFIMVVGLLCYIFYVVVMMLFVILNGMIILVKVLLCVKVLLFRIICLILVGKFFEYCVLCGLVVNWMCYFFDSIVLVKVWVGNIWLLVLLVVIIKRGVVIISGFGVVECYWFCFVDGCG